MGFITQKYLGIIGEKGFQAGPQKLLKPFRDGKKWLILKTGELKKGKIRGLDEVSAMAKNKVFAIKIRERRTEWKEELKNKYKAEINEELFAEI